MSLQRLTRGDERVLRQPALHEPGGRGAPIQIALLDERPQQVHVARQVIGAAEELDHRRLLERLHRPLGPVLALEQDVAVQPHHGVAIARQGFERAVQQALLLPHHVPRRHLDEHGGVVRIQLEPALVPLLHRQQRHILEVAPKVR